MNAILSAPPVPAMLVAMGCLAGIAHAHTATYAPPETIRPVAESAIVDDADGEDFVTEDANASKVIDRAPDGLFYVTARINGRPVRFVVDTGSSYMVLCPKDAAAVGATPPTARFRERMQTAAGITPMAWAHIASVRMAGHKIGGVRAAVVRRGLDISLLGQNMLSRLGSVRIEGNQMMLG